MTIEYQISVEDDLVTLVGIGEMLDAETRDCIQRLQTDPDLAPAIPVFVDLAAVSKVSLSREGIRSLIDILETTDDVRGGSRTAILVSKTGLAVMADLFGSSAENRGLKRNIRTFLARDEAMEWLREMPGTT